MSLISSLRLLVQPGVFEHLLCPGVAGEDDVAEVAERPHDRGESCRVVGVLGAVDGGQAVLVKPEVGEDRGGPRHCGVLEKGVDHHVAGEVDARGDALPPQVLHRRLCRAEEEIGDMIGEHPVHLLGHPAVEAPQSGLDVCHRHMEFRRRQGACQGGVRVAVDEHQVGLLGQDHPLDPGEHRPGLAAVGARSDPEVVVWPRDLELLEEEV